jgi:hypothetical protein
MSESKLMNIHRLTACLGLALALPFAGCAVGGGGMIQASDGSDRRGSAGGSMFAHQMQAPSVLDAAARGDLRGVDAALSAGGDVNSRNAVGATALQLASAGGYLPIVQTLLAHGAAVNAADNNGVTPLAAATAGGYADVARALVASGAQGASAPAPAAPAGGSTPWYQSK